MGDIFSMGKFIFLYNGMFFLYIFFVWKRDWYYWFIFIFVVVVVNVIIFIIVMYDNNCLVNIIFLDRCVLGLFRRMLF